MKPQLKIGPENDQIESYIELEQSKNKQLKFKMQDYQRQLMRPSAIGSHSFNFDGT